MLKYAITGNIASGKSEVEKILRDKGFAVVDTDDIAHGILESSDAVKSEFGKFDILTDGRIDRKKLGALVFSNPEMLNKLESIIHPLVKNRLLKIFNGDFDTVFVSVPQLFEAGFEGMFDGILYIYADKNIRLKRLMQRNNLSESEALARLNAQIPDEEKKDKSDYVIENNGGLNALNEQIERFLLNQQIV